jgi:hypothetical protein
MHRAAPLAQQRWHRATARARAGVLTWRLRLRYPQSLSYSVPSRDGKGEPAVLLRDVSGVLQPGAMTALVRASH